ncbi:MAG: M48 family metalloprotease [Thermoleophilia bacterium]
MSGVPVASPLSRRSLFEIEHEKASRVWLLFAVLLAMVFVAAWVVCLIVGILVVLFIAPGSGMVAWLLSWRGAGVVLLATLAITSAYWFNSRIGAREKLLRAMHCVALDPHDHYHQRLANVVDELRLATGSPRIDCVTVQTLGLNAFSFSDLKGGGVVGVTEGALSRLSRQQLQAVVAHEFGHIVSGSYVTVTVSCLLFGIYSSLGDELEDATLVSAASNAAPVGVPVALGARVWLAALQLGSSLIDAALSRERERQADLAAARYTRDPLSLAEALTIIQRHPGGAGHIPEGLAPLCIRDTQAVRSGVLARWRQTHPPIDERVTALLALANVSRADFEQQMGQASENLMQKEHRNAAPQPRTAPHALGDLLAGGAPLVTAAPAVLSPQPAVAAGAGGALSCPDCGSGLGDVQYEGVMIHSCARCGGTLVGGDALRRILARREVGFTDEQRRLADYVAINGDQLRRQALATRGNGGEPLLSCPRCGKKMMRRHVNYEHAIDVDRCTICDVIWFRKNELEALQVLTERQVD